MNSIFVGVRVEASTAAGGLAEGEYDLKAPTTQAGKQLSATNTKVTYELTMVDDFAIEGPETLNLAAYTGMPRWRGGRLEETRLPWGRSPSQMTTNLQCAR